MSRAAPLKAPFPYFGGKSRVAAEVWLRFGDVKNYVEPFCGSAAMLLGRPHAPRVETVNDANGFIANFWRAVTQDPAAVAQHADWPINEADLHARHRGLMLGGAAEAFRERMKTDADYFDARVAGWWAWGACCWIGAGWCDGARVTGRSGGPSNKCSCVDVAKGVNTALGEKRPRLTGFADVGGCANVGEGRRPHLGRAYALQASDGGGAGLTRKLPSVSPPRQLVSGGGDALVEWMRALAARLRRVRVRWLATPAQYSMRAVSFMHAT